MANLKELIAYAESNERVCLMPEPWNALWEMLPNRQRNGAGWEPALPLILAAWWDTPIIAKMMRFREHLEYADRHAVLAEVDRFVRSLPESDWAHKNDFSSR